MKLISSKNTIDFRRLSLLVALSPPPLSWQDCVLGIHLETTTAAEAAEPVVGAALDALNAHGGMLQ